MNFPRPVFLTTGKRRVTGTVYYHGEEEGDMYARHSIESCDMYSILITVKKRRTNTYAHYRVTGV